MSVVYGFIVAVLQVRLEISVHGLLDQDIYGDISVRLNSWRHLKTC
jgi:hypothetical protein